MSLNRYNAKRDANERPIVEAYRRAGAKVLLLDQVDLLVLYKGKLFLREVKMPNGRLTKAQERLIAEGWPVECVEDPIEALKGIGAVK